MLIDTKRAVFFLISLDRSDHTKRVASMSLNTLFTPAQQVARFWGLDSSGLSTRLNLRLGGEAI